MAHDGWHRMRLGDFVTLQRGHDLPDAQRRPGPIPVLGSFGVTGYHDTAKASGPGVTVGRSGASFGVVTYSPVDYWPLNTALYVVDFHGNDERFAYYFLKSLDFRRYNSGSAQPSLNRNYIHPIPVEVPPLQEQRAIAHVLGTLDDKIGLNRRMNETLEAIARAIFKSWFVDFDPVRAKMEGREPTGMDAATAELFPDALQDSSLGQIPRGWTVRQVLDLVEFAYGRALKESDRRPGNVAVYGSNGQVGWHDEPLVEGPGIVIGRKGNPGVVTWVPTDFFPIDTTFYVVPKGSGWSLHYLYFALARLDLPALSADSAVPGLNRNIACMSRLLSPPPEVLGTFDSVRGHLAERVRANDEESRTLTELRDALLPALVSGRLRVGRAAEP